MQAVFSLCLTVGFLAVAVGLGVVVCALRQAPTGFEDDTGFHYGRELRPDLDEAA